MEADIIGLIVTLLFYSFFAGGVAAFMSVDKLRFEVERKSGLALDILSHFLRNPGDFISAMLVGKNLALVICVVLTVDLIGEIWQANSFLLIVVQIVVSAFFILFVGEGMSKLLFKVNPDGVLRILGESRWRFAYSGSAFIRVLCLVMPCIQTDIRGFGHCPEAIWRSHP